MNEEMIFQRIEKILERMGQKEQLQSLAKEKGLPINELELTNDTKDAVVLSVIALMLAKQEGDPRYRKLSDFGMQKRSLKVELINDYKQRANMLLNKYRSHGTPDQVSYVDTPIDEYSTIQEEDDDECIDESFFDTFKPRPKPTNFSTYKPNNEKQDWKRVAMNVADEWVRKNTPEDLMKFLENENVDLNDKYFEVNKNKYTFKKNESSKYNFGDWFYDELVKGFMLYYSKDIDSTDQLESLFETHKDDIPSIPILDDIIDDNDKAWRIAYSFQLKEYIMFSTEVSKENNNKIVKLGKSWTNFIKKFK